MTNYDVYIISLDSLDVVIKTLNIWLNYETEGLLNSDDKDNICRIIGQFLKATKRKIQIENGINQEILNLYDSIKDLPGELKEKIVEFEKSYKLNPSQDRREKIISEEEIKKVAKKIDNEIGEEI